MPSKRAFHFSLGQHVIRVLSEQQRRPAASMRESERGIVGV